MTLVKGKRIRRILGWTMIGVIAIMIVASAVYFRDIHQHYGRIGAKGTVIPSPYGDIEYTTGGSGTPVLVVHGSGGGWDQGEILAGAVLGDQFQWIAPSRFGYLRSTFHAGATFDDQAHAYAYLLDQLGIKKVAVVALSHGGPSALLFAVLHPGRVSSLTLVSCGVASIATQDQEDANQKGDMLTTIYKHDPLYWGITKLFKKQFMELMGANDQVLEGLTSEQQELIERVIDSMNPVSPRAEGVSFDNKAEMPNQRIASIKAPTLILHATDDGLQLYHNAEFAASNIPDSRLMSFDRGGHFLMIVEQNFIRTVTQKHILDHMNEEAPAAISIPNRTNRPRTSPM